MPCSTDLLGSAPFILAGFVQLMQEYAVFVWMRSPGCEGPCRKLGRKNEIHPLLVSAGEDAERIAEIMAENNNLLLMFNDFKVGKEMKNANYQSRKLS